LGEPSAVCLYSTLPGSQFLLAQASMIYALIALSGPESAIPGEVIAGFGATVTGGVHMA